MGIYDRDYYQEPSPSGYQWNGPRSVVGVLIMINLAVFLADGLLTPQTHTINGTLALSVASLTKPWLWWKFLTYGFAHASVPEYGHIIGNMIGLFFFGRPIEQRYGSREFVRLYLTMILVAGIAWALTEWLQGAPPGTSAVGASGAVVGIVVLFALNYPRATVLLFFVIPMPAWVAGILLVGYDCYHATMNPETSQIAHMAHLGGAAFALLYFKNGWNLTRLIPWSFSQMSRPKGRKPKLRVHRPGPDEAEQSDLSEEVDRILDKIHREGEASLTRKERRVLENASREYQKKRRSSED